MTWLTWRQLRLQSTVVVAALAALALALLLTAHGLRSGYRADLSSFIDQLQFNRVDGFLYVAGLVAVHSAAPVIAAFWGGPLIARELEAGTHRLVWNQGTTRQRWLSVKLIVTGGIAAVVVGSLSGLLTWWSSPIDRAVAAGHGSGSYSLPRMDPVVFGARGIVAVGYVVLGIAFGVTVGLLIRRSIPAVAMTLVFIAAAEILVPHYVRSHLVSPVVKSVVINTENLRGIQIHPGPTQQAAVPVRLTVRAGGPGDWGMTNETVDSTGRAVSILPTSFAECLHTRIGVAPNPANKARSERNDLQPCFTALADAGYRQHVTYLAAGSFWALQVRETGLLLVVAGLLIALCFWRIRRDVS